VVRAPTSAGIGVVILLAGVPAYYAWSLRQPRAARDV
jgi:hypothetical protein